MFMLHAPYYSLLHASCFMLHATTTTPPPPPPPAAAAAAAAVVAAVAPAVHFIL